MKNTEVKDLGINLFIFLEDILNEDSRAEDVANSGISMVIEILRNHPKIHHYIDDMMTSYDSEDDNFEKRWDLEIAWIKWAKENIK